MSIIRCAAAIAVALSVAACGAHRPGSDSLTSHVDENRLSNETIRDANTASSTGKQQDCAITMGALRLWCHSISRYY
ncbi:MAG TPA: hypothetical protein VFS39_07570 [Nitrospira sp.]|nr:hypothetical protein [Nitrospira sp.]